MSKKLSTIFVIILCVAAIIGVRYFQKNGQVSLTKDKMARAKGNPNAPIKIVEFIDFQCPACAMGSKYLREKFEEYPDKFYLELNYYPLGMHKHAMISAQYVECAARQGKLWPYHDKILDRQQSWKNLNDATPAFQIMAKELDMNLEALNQCLENEEITAFIMKSKDKGNSLGIKSTPTYFVNDKLLVGSKSLDIEIKKLLGIQ